MAIFSGRYRWDGTKRGESEPISWSPGAYDLKIFQRATFSEKVQHLKPYVCIYAQTGEGQSISASPEKFAKQICHDFSLEIEQVLWVEDLLNGKDRYEVVMFARSVKMGATVFYHTQKRLASPAEVRMIERELAGLVNEVKI